MGRLINKLLLFFSVLSISHAKPKIDRQQYPDASNLWNNWNPTAADADFGLQIEELKKFLLKSKELKTKIGNDRGLRAYYTQVLTQLRHVSWEFSIRDRSYTHELVIEGRYPRVPTQIAIQKAREFLSMLQIQTPLALEPKPKELPTISPSEMATRKEAAIKKQYAFKGELTSDALGVYKTLRMRLLNDGPEASFERELGPVADHLYLEILSDPVVNKVCAQTNELNAFRNVVLAGLQDVAEGEPGKLYPYTKTNEAIQRAVEFFDIIRRADDPTRSPKLYHSHRYDYYGHFLKAQIPDHIMLPTLVSLGATDILKVRGVPIGLIGVNTDVMWVDGFYQTPYEFWVHDINHSRRMYQFLKEAADAQGLTVEEFAVKSDAFLRQHVLPLISISKEDQQLSAQAAEKLRLKIKPTAEEYAGYARANKKRLLKVLLFEILHEDALAASPEILKNAVLRPPNLITPFEAIKGEEVIYVMEPGATTLAYAFRKLAHDFYDMPGARLDNVVAEEFRTRENIVEAAEHLFRSLGFRTRREILEYFVSTDQGFPADFKQTVKNDISARPGETVPLDQEVSLAEKPLRSIVAENFHEYWQRNSGYVERWKIAQAVFKDGRGINDNFFIQTEEQLNEHLAERAIPQSYRKHFSFRVDPQSGRTVLFEDIQHLPHQFLANNNQFENIQSASDAVRIIEKISEEKVEFQIGQGHAADFEKITDWLKDRLQEMNMEWLRRNATWAKADPEYNRAWKNLPAVKQQHGVTLLKMALDAETMLDPSKIHPSQKALLNEALRRIEVDIINRGRAEVRIALAGDNIHELWRQNTNHVERWKPAEATLWDGTPITNEFLREAYLIEKKIPAHLRRYFEIRPNPLTHEPTLFEDIRNLPNFLLSKKHQEENIKAGEKALQIVDRFWDKKLEFHDIDQTERWLTAAAQEVHARFLAPTANGAFTTPEYAVHWLDLPAVNQRHDFSHVQAAFAARLRLQPEGISIEQQDIIHAAMNRLENKLLQRIQGDSECEKILSGAGNYARERFRKMHQPQVN